MASAGNKDAGESDAEYDAWVRTCKALAVQAEENLARARVDPSSPMSGLEDETRVPLRLMFAASGDLRNLIETVVSLDEAVAAGDAVWPSAGVDIRFNNPDATAFIRNLVMLRLLLEAGEREEVLHAVLTMWYSIVMESAHGLLFGETVATILAEAKRAQFKDHKWTLQTDTPCASTVRVVVPLALESALARTARTFAVAGEQVDDVRARQWYHNRVWTTNRRGEKVMRVAPKYRMCVWRFVETGVFQPFAARLDEEPLLANPTYFTYDAIDESGYVRDGSFVLHTYDSPLRGWDIPRVLAWGKAQGCPSRDVFGALYFYVRDKLRSFVRVMRQRNVTLRFTSMDPGDFLDHARRHEHDSAAPNVAHVEAEVETLLAAAEAKSGAPGVTARPPAPSPKRKRRSRKQRGKRQPPKALLVPASDSGGTSHRSSHKQRKANLVAAVTAAKTAQRQHEYGYDTFDRIDTGDLAQHGELGAAKALGWFGSCLAFDRLGSKLLIRLDTRGIVAVGGTPEAVRMRWQRTRRMLAALPPTSDARLSWFNSNEIGLNYASDVTPELAMRLEEDEGVRDQCTTCRLVVSTRNAIHPYRPGVPLGAPHSTLPYQPVLKVKGRPRFVNDAYAGCGGPGKPHADIDALRAAVAAAPDVWSHEGLSWEFALGRSHDAVALEFGLLYHGDPDMVPLGSESQRVRSSEDSGPEDDGYDDSEFEVYRGSPALAYPLWHIGDCRKWMSRRLDEVLKRRWGTPYAILTSKMPLAMGPTAEKWMLERGARFGMGLEKHGHTGKLRKGYVGVASR